MCNITLKGLVSGQTGVEMMHDIYNSFYAGKIRRSTLDNAIGNYLQDDDYRRVDSHLQDLIGVYPLDLSTTEPYWRTDFINRFDDWMWRIKNITHTVKEEYDNENTFYEIKNELFQALFNASFASGTMTDNQGRTVKILKYLPKRIQQISTYTAQELEAQPWYKFYVTHKESMKQLYLVVTNSIASQFGMSGFAPEMDGSKLWSSCQSIGRNAHSYALRIWSYFADVSSLIMYVTDGTNVKMEAIPRYEHHQMIARWELRMLHVNTYLSCPRCKTINFIKTLYHKCTCGHEFYDEERLVLMLDRAYPNDMYAEVVIKKLKEISNLPICLPVNYNAYQESDCNCDYGQFYIDSIKRNATTAYYIEPGKTRDDDAYVHYDDQGGCMDDKDDDSYVMTYNIWTPRTIKSFKKSQAPTKRVRMLTSCVDGNINIKAGMEGILLFNKSTGRMLIQFDNHIYGHNGKGRGKDGYCWWCDYMSDEGKTWEYVPIDDKKENEDGLEEVV